MLVPLRVPSLPLLTVENIFLIPLLVCLLCFLCFQKWNHNNWFCFLNIQIKVCFSLVISVAITAVFTAIVNVFLFQICFHVELNSQISKCFLTGGAYWLLLVFVDEKLTVSTPEIIIQSTIRQNGKNSPYL